MKKIIFLIILTILVGAGSYKYIFRNNSIYSTTLPKNYENFEKDMFNVLIKLNPVEKNLLLNYSIRFRKLPNEITVKEAIDNERDFEKTDEATLFFSKLKEQDKKNSIIEEINNSAFVTFVDYVLEENSITVVFSLKNKTQETITSLSGESLFIIDSDRFITTLEFNNVIPPTETIQINRKFNFSEFPALKDLSHNSTFKMTIKNIQFQNGTTLSN